MGQSQFNLGVGVLDATLNPEPVPDSRFFSWLAQVQRVQRLGKDNLLIMQGDLQLTPDSLLSFHQFLIGGGQSVRGYAQSCRSGDNGVRLSLEARLPVVRQVGAVSSRPHLLLMLAKCEIKTAIPMGQFPKDY